ncbi:MAG: YeeE/YedE family protein [Paracoccaceae bacterium]
MQAEWIMGLAGGLMIGIAGAVYLLANGRIMGASGILGEVVEGARNDGRAERIAFLAALVAVPALLFLLSGRTADTHISGNPLVVVAAGLLVGFGTRIAGGCTSGHGVCGISRLSPRGIVATLLYMLGGAVTLVLMRHWLGVV